MTVPAITLAIAGGSGSGKTTLTERLFKELGGAENVTVLNHDYYYKDLSHQSLEERAEANFDHPESLETDLLLEHIKMLKQGLPTNVPTYDFATHSRTSEVTATQPRKIIIVEGILIFCHPELVKELDVKVFVVSDASKHSLNPLYFRLNWCTLAA
jgi:uridine kinase